MSFTKKFEVPQPKVFERWLDASYGTKGNRYWYFTLYSADSGPLNRPGKARTKMSNKDRSFRLFEDTVEWGEYKVPIEAFGPKLFNNRRKPWYLCELRLPTRVVDCHHALQTPDDKSNH